jgi:hypothetical protein
MENAKLKNECQELRRINEVLVENINAEARPDKYQRSPRNGFHRMMEANVMLKGPPIAGGGTGLQR